VTTLAVLETGEVLPVWAGVADGEAAEVSEALEVSAGVEV